MKTAEDTLILFKPDALQRGLVGDILTRFERVGLKIVASKMIHPDRDHYAKHYEDIGKLKTRAGDDIFDMTLGMMSEGPVIAMVLRGIDAVKLVRKLIGGTEPQSAAPGTIRGDFSHMSYEYANEQKKGIPNLIHASGSLEDAQAEILHWFAANEVYEYKVLNEKFTR